MDVAEKKRKMIIGGILVATLVAAALVEVDDEPEFHVPEALQSGRTTQDRTKRTDSNAAAQLDVSKLGQRKFSPLAGELFMSTNWVPKRVVIDDPEEHAAKIAQAAKNMVPPAPTAPPLQFKYAGKAIADNETWVFLSQSGENLITKIGGKINDAYRLDSINDNAITMTYLPLNIKQTLTINNQIAGTF
ncbi:hypothetical protein [Nitrosomonas ureae]|uniref:Prolin-rich transmembrane protein n=1 Tax=Nitrosomonas ureae TaxID=44577 RepID=A0A1H5S7A3_9PROT|nr:hypothetical protein [Nitrosomonas ureae]SEF45631.1 hypothetical protein SAMN05216334_10219 [Nitrosomonas ureae]